MNEEKKRKEKKGKEKKNTNKQDKQCCKLLQVSSSYFAETVGFSKINRHGYALSLLARGVRQSPCGSVRRF